jgi:hypothetical protein
MVNTIKPSQSLKAGRHLDPFLCTVLGNEANGTPLTVLSALARADVDPWLEAERLAKMPTRAAGERLRSLFKNLPGGRSIFSGDSDVAVDRLIGLLPRGEKDPVSPPRATPRANGPAIDWRVAIYITLGLMIGIQLLSRNAIKPPNVGAAAASTQTELQPKVRTPLRGG